ncbi:MAG TPA: DEAD/DEAH box helicase, partial [Polyangiaceae bacterium]|nr:DEAD/DEAH box helicase [Polyangiaceae bacterium]
MSKSPLSPFRPAVQEWFASALGEPTRAQGLAFGPIAAGASTLLLAPTGSGKTLAAFLAALDKLAFTPEPPKDERCRVVYVSPLKALAVDIERNLRAPLAGILETAKRRGDTARSPTVAVRTGDTAAVDRTRIARTPPDILITTPESLYLMLTSSAREALVHVDTVIVDEIHALAPSKRGAHLFFSIERLEAIRAPEAGKLQRIGLSATQRPLEEIARLLGGFDRGKARPVTVVDAGHKKRLDLTIEVPEIDMARLGEIDELASGPAASGGARRTIWPHVHQRIVELVKAHRSTILFVNSRRLAERLAGAINEVAGEEIALAHHGSVAREQRAAIEDRLKRGQLPAIVATSSLELGIDMGAVDLVIQVESPPSVASGMQRIGRASHQVGGVPQGVILPKHRADLLAATAAAAGMRAGEVEETAYPRNPLDVLAQQIVATVAREPSTADALFDLARRAAPFAELPRSSFEGVLDMLSGRYPSSDFRDLRARVTWDRTRGRVSAREGAQRLAITNGGTIPDRGLYGVFLRDADGAKSGKGSRRVGELDEEMVFELKEGEVFLLGASSWRADEITRDRVIVTPAAGEPGKMPFWHGDRPGRPRAFGEAIGALTRRLARASDDEATRALVEELRLDASASKNLIAYVREQQSVTGEVPSDRAIVVERFRDELGDWRVCLLTPFGARVHAPWATVVLARLNERYAGDVEAVWTDDGIAFRIPASDEPPDPATFFPPSAEVESLVVQTLGHTSLFAARFREAAARALLLPRRSPGKRTPLWAQRKRAYDLLAVASQYPSFPIVLETYRECLRDVFDLPSLALVLQRVESRRIRVTPCDSRTPSPFASSLLFSFVANFIYDGDAPLAERRAQALTIDHAQLRELLGEAELRQLLDPEAIEAHVRALQRLERPAKHADGAHDLLLSLGDLSMPAIEARAQPRLDLGESAAGWMAALENDRRVARVTIAGERRFIAGEDVGRYRDALGVVPPRGMPDAFLEPVKDAWGDLVSRWARTHGPFTAGELADRFGVGADTIGLVVDRLVAAGKLVEGAFLRQGQGRELCDADVLGAIRRKSLAKLRREIEPVDAAAYGRFVQEWQAVSNRRRGRDALMETVAQLQGCPLPASVLDARILGARVEGFRPWDLDALCASGRVTWAGVEPLGPSDGRVALYLAEDEALLSPPPKKAEGDLAAKIRELLERRGAIFFPEIAAVAGGFPAEALDALWSMVWAGEVTNDTLEPLRSMAEAASGKSQNRRAGHAGHRAPRRSALPGSEGRWSLRAARLGPPPSETERRAALTRTLLERYGVLTREAVHAEGIEGGFSAVYDVLKALEDGGRVRRGYFLAGRGATQFALPGADDRLRAMRAPSENPRATVLAATDPANPYGATLPWPARPESEGEGRRPQRAAGALVVLFDGALAGWVGRGGDSLLTFLPADEATR